MRSLAKIAVAVLLAVPAAGGVRVLTGDGRELRSVPDPVSGALHVIVQFGDTPLFAASRIRMMSNSTDARSALRSAEQRAAQFAADLQNLHESGLRRARAPRAGTTDSTSAVEPLITRSFSRVFSGASVVIDRADRDAVRKLSYVAAVYDDLPVRASLDESVQRINADKVWATFGTRGSGVVVAVIDTGVNYNHPAFGGGFGPGHRVAGGYDLVNNDADPIDDAGHGTHVAGIIAANGGGLTGVAPDVTLLVYKVLDAEGKGLTSNVLAGIERAADPNGDGNPADHADVVNMSLGGDGSIDDPLVQAVETATAAGSLFCISAGNTGAFYDVQSPAIAPSAIAVGAADGNDGIAFFSSHGPVGETGAIKPEVSAPGVNIESANWLGGTVAMSGTSMAAPHVTGVAALLKAIHRTWTPAQLKAAIVETAIAHDGSDVMVEGSGRVDALQAAEDDLIASPPTLAFGHDDLTLGTWSAARTLVITNLSSQPRSLSAAVPGAQAGVTVTASPASFTLNPGQSTEVTISVQVANATSFTPKAGSLALYGRVIITGGAVPIHVPWAFLKSVPINVTYDRDDGFFVYVVSAADSALTAVATAARGTTSAAAYVPAGDYDIAVGSDSFDPANTISRTIVLEQQHAATRLDLNLRSEMASNEIAIDATDEHSDSLAGSRQRVNVFTLQPVSPAAGIFIEEELSPSFRYFVSNVSKRFTMYPSFHCSMATASYSAQFPPLAGVTQTVREQVGGADWVRVPVEVPIPKGLKNPAVALESAEMKSYPSKQISHSWSVTSPVEEAAATWSGTLFLTPEYDAYYGNVGRVSLLADMPVGWTGPTFFGQAVMLAAPWVRVRGDAVELTPYYTDGPVTYATRPNTTLRFGTGLVHPESRIFLLEGVVATDFVGNLDEARNGEAAQQTLALYDGSGALVATGIDAIRATRFNSMPYRLELSSTLQGGAAIHVTATSDVRQADSAPPAMTSLRLLDVKGNAIDQLGTGEHGTLVFSALDRAALDGAHIVQPLRTGKTEVGWRAHGATAWTTLQYTLGISELANTPMELDALGHAPAGQVFSSDLSPATHAGASAIDLKFHFEDLAGNTYEFTLSPAFTVLPPPPRRRAEGH